MDTYISPSRFDFDYTIGGASATADTLLCSVSAGTRIDGVRMMHEDIKFMRSGTHRCARAAYGVNYSLTFAHARCACERVCVWRSAKGEAISTRRWLGYHLHPCADTTTDCVYTARAEPLLCAAGSIISQAAAAALFDLRPRAHARTHGKLCVCAGCAAISRGHCARTHTHGRYRAGAHQHCVRQLYCACAQCELHL